MKQIWVASTAGCTDAAVSLWESGRRIPCATLADRIFGALSAVGASPDKIANLQRLWRAFRCQRKNDVQQILLDKVA